MASTIYQLEVRLPGTGAGTGPIRVDLPLPGARVGSDPACSVHLDEERIPVRWLDVRVEGDRVTFTVLDGAEPVSLTVPVGHWSVLSAAHVRVVPAARTTYQTEVLEARFDEVFAAVGDPGWADPYLELFDNDPPTRFAITVGQTVWIGRRKKECDIALSDAEDRISRRHASIQWQGDLPFLRDNSSNGTLWQRPSAAEDYRAIGRDQPLVHDDRFRIGPWTLRFCWPQATLADEVGDIAAARAEPVSRFTKTASPRRARQVNWLFWCASALAVLCVAGIVWILAG